MKYNIDKLPSNSHSEEAIDVLDAAEILGFKAYSLSPLAIPRQFTHAGTTYKWENKTSSLHAKYFRRGYRAAKAVETK